MAILPDPSTPASDLPPLPPLLLALLAPWWPALLAWLTTWLERRLLARCQHHPLVRLAHALDLTPVIRACAAFHHQHGPGAPARFPVALLVRADLLRAWRGDCSDRCLETTLASDLLARWFVGLPLGAPAPDHTTLARFHAWRMTHAPAALFEQVLATLDRADPEPAHSPQIVDTFAMHAAAAPTMLPRLLAITTTRLQHAWRAHAPDTALPSPPPIPPRWLPPTTRPAALHAAAAAASATLAALAAARTHLPTRVTTALDPMTATLQRILTATCACAADGTWAERARPHKAAFRPTSPTDLDATTRNHGQTPPILGYNAAISTTHTRIRSAVVVTGSTPDPETLVPLLAQQQARGDPLPAHVIGDQAFGWGRLRAQVIAATDGQTQVVARIPAPGGRDHTRFGPPDFQVNGAATTCTCPNGVTTSLRYAAPNADGWSFRFTATQCAGCPLWTQCRARDAVEHGNRTVFLSAHHGTLRVAAAFNASAAGQGLLKERWRVEAAIAWLVRSAGARRVRRIGQPAAQGHLWDACAVVNLRRWLRRIAVGTAPPAPPVAGIRPLAG